MSDIKKLGKFEVRRELGKGAMGVVYEGFDPMIERSVAIKTIRPETLLGADAEDQLARFRREAQAAGRLTHPNIVSIYDYGQDGDTYFIAMEFVKGRELLDILKRDERFDVKGVVRLMDQLLDALDYSHRNGVVHRDIKPANIILLADGTVKVADFGIARVESSNLTQVGTVLGTPSYMSPEQFMGQTVDGRSDLFSAGVILYQLLTGERPFTGAVTTIMHKVLQEQPLPPSTLNVQISPAFDAVIRKALAKRPDERFQTGHEFAQAIRTAAQASSAAAADSTSDATVVLGAAALASADTLQQPAPTGERPMLDRTQADAGHARSAPASRTSTPVVAAVGVVAVLAVAMGAWTFWGQAPAPVSTSTAAANGAPQAPTATPPATALEPAAEMIKAAPGTVVVSAMGLVDPTDIRYRDDRAALESALRADSRSQLVEKTLGLYVQHASLASNYDRLRETLLAKSADYIVSVDRESAPQLGKDGLMFVTTQAVVKARQLQRSLNQMSRDERVDFIRTAGDPKISVRVTTRDADRSDGDATTSPIAENMLKERIKSFGFRTWSDDTGAAQADFVVSGEARIKKLSAKLPASGLTITKFTLTSWTVKCTDRESGEEVYFNTSLPKGIGSWASEEEALQAIGGKLADEFSRDFFLQHFGMTGRKVVLKLGGVSDARTAQALQRELISLGGVLWTAPRSGTGSPTFDLQLSGGGSAQELVVEGILKPLNAKLGKSCFGLGASAGEEVSVIRDASCSEASIYELLEASPPAGLHESPPSRQRSVVKNPETLKKLTI